jgi:hypothetical protein
VLPSDNASPSSSFLRSRALLYFLGAVLVTAALLGAAPYAASHPRGLQAAVAVANSMAPVRLHVDSLSAGWGSPVIAEGVRVTERASQPRASASGPGARQGGPSSASSSGDEPGGGGGGAGRRVTLLQLDRVRTTCTLWQLVRGGGPADVLVSRPQVDLSLSPSGGLRVAQALERAGLVPRPHTPAAQRGGPVGAMARAAAAAAAQMAAPDADDASSSSGGSGGSGGEEAPGAGAAAAARSRRAADAAARGDAGRARTLSAALDMAVPSSRRSRAAPAPVQPPAPPVGGGGGGPGAAVPASLQRAAARVAFTGELRMGSLSVTLSDGELHTPAELRCENTQQRHASSA